MKAPEGDGWIPWPEHEHGQLRQPLEQLGGLEHGETIESRYDYDGERLYRAWSRKVSCADH